jgi:hypothetical protein
MLLAGVVRQQGYENTAFLHVFAVNDAAMTAR